MNYRERVIRTMQFQDVDSRPFRRAYGLMPGVLEEWHVQGPPAWEYAVDTAIARAAYASARENREIDLSHPDWTICYPTGHAGGERL